MNSSFFDYNQEISILSTPYGSKEGTERYFPRKKKSQTKEDMLLSSIPFALLPQGDKKKILTRRNGMKDLKTQQVLHQFKCGSRSQEPRRAARDQRKSKISAKKFIHAFNKAKLRQNKQGCKEKKNSNGLKIASLTTDTCGNGREYQKNLSKNEASKLNFDSINSESTKFGLLESGHIKLNSNTPSNIHHGQRLGYPISDFQTPSRNENLPGLSIFTDTKIKTPLMKMESFRITNSKVLLARLRGKLGKASLTSPLNIPESRRSKKCASECKVRKPVADKSDIKAEKAYQRMEKLLGKFDECIRDANIYAGDSAQISLELRRTKVRRKIRAYNETVNV
ncbi:unnamed protein product [Moneuplotes crassus]|uniref:Uncharacterized protein n=1 Tax=Euplotes crassus TaxID=5936 RepID=A0AAD1XYN0_EUPCR|nr:unnamed protein product [Moneuplotes crassus]